MTSGLLWCSEHDYPTHGGRRCPRCVDEALARLCAHGCDPRLCPYCEPTPIPRPALEVPNAPSEPDAMPENAGLYSDESACDGCGAPAVANTDVIGGESFAVCAECARVLA